MDKVLIICKEQFGYHTDIFKWCEYLRDDYNVEVVTFDGKPKVSLEGVKVHYVSNKGIRNFRGIKFILTSLWYLMSLKCIPVVCYFKECRLLKWCLPWKKMILDIRTLGINRDKATLEKVNKSIEKAANTYDYVTVISEGVREKISLSKDKSAILPLGADVVSTTKKSFNTIRLLYIGTLFNRDIDKTIKGLSIALNNNSTLDIHYDIIGVGHSTELDDLKKLVKDYNLDNYVTLHGYIQHGKLKEFLDKCNVGVSFVPMTEFYEHQPVTKSFEYILSGLYTIGTSTYCNKEIITKDNGVLINDTPEAFAEGIEYIARSASALDSEFIRKTLMQYQWRNIVNDIYKPILNNFSKG